MPDFGSPVVTANSGYDPNKGLETLSNLMGLKQKNIAIQQAQQNLDTGAINQGRAQSEAQQQAQTAQQRAALAKVDWGKYQDENGYTSVDKMLADPELRQAAGDSFLDVAKTGAAIRGQQIANSKAFVDLAADQREQVSKMLGGLRTDPDVVADNDVGRKKVDLALAQFSTQGGPEAKKFAQTYGPLVEHTPQGKLVQSLSNVQLQGMAAASQTTAQAPSYTNTGGTQQNVNPQAAGGNLTQTPKLINTPAPGINPTTGQPYTVDTAPAKAPAPPEDHRIQAMPQFPTPQEAAQATAANDRWTQVRQADSSPSSGYMPTKQVYSNLLEILKKNPAVGPGSAGWNSMLRVLTPLGLSPNANYQEVVGYLDRLAGQNASTANATTNFAREQAANATGTPDFDPVALGEKLKFGASVNEASHAYRAAVDAFSAKNGRAAPYNASQFDAAWAKNADPVAFRIMSSSGLGDQEDVGKQKVTALNLHHYRNLRDYLLKGKLPPDDQ
jgi:hypothetical protein